MSKKRSSKQIRNIIILVITLLILILITFLIFIFTVDIKKVTPGINNVSFQNIANPENIINVTGEGIAIIDGQETAKFESVAYDRESSLQIKFSEGKLYLTIINQELFNEKYKNSKLDIGSKKEITIHDYKIQEIYIQKCADSEYLLAIMEDGSMGVMNIDEAIKENVFRLKNELIRLDDNIVKVYQTVKILDEKEIDAAIIETSNRQKYDLQKFVE